LAGYYGKEYACDCAATTHATSHAEARMTHIALGPLPAVDLPLDLRVLRLVHPFPSVLNAAAVVGVAFAAADGPPPWSVVWRMALAMLLVQFAIGTANDVFDQQLDARAKPWKPIPAGLVGARLAVVLTMAFLALALGLTATLGFNSLALLCLGAACGLAYDALLKRSPWSPAPFAIAIPVLPIWVYVTLDRWEPVLWWLLPLGGLLGVALHLANTAPDIEADAANGVRGLAHRLGLRRSVLAAWTCFAGALLFAFALWPALDAQSEVYATVLLFGFVSLLVAGAAYVRYGQRALELQFGLLAIASCVAAGAWLAAVT
jgi:4-hydroxybenzoate polyprenyltransferase